MEPLQNWLRAAHEARALCQNKAALDLRIAEQEQRLFLMYFPEIKHLRLTYH